nr:MAG TPA: hypothetical protein [Caudoviricetes sp.]DAO76429.1 MAG TPA: hypothetical protein [Bacteriophage sp.]DAN82030.1 MAG TPA: hypothetical protein [Caudoviricetes sp.]DAR99740.1 MAG TPA: hypothetical protein [Caudoviricetes sp.]DAS06181.1 MAG TPA: hypothetical protein [Caudoviricetes sp.]
MIKITLNSRQGSLKVVLNNNSRKTKEQPC